jgi:hypothetical protein
VRGSILLFVALTGCAPRAPGIAARDAAPPRAVPVHLPPTCARGPAAPLPAVAGDRAVFREAHDRARSSPAWGRGVAAVELPPGFVRLPDPRRRAPTLDEDDPGEEYLSDEDRRDHVASYRLQGDPDDPRPNVEVVTVRYFRRPGPAARPAGLLRYLAGASWAGGLERLEIEDASLATDFNWVQELVDARGRRVVEWGLVEKGCERAEAFEHFVEDQGFVWHVSLEVQPTAPAAQLAEWLARFFDAPFGGPAPERRAALGGALTPR